MLLYWPGAWSICLAADPGTLPDSYLLGAFGVGKKLGALGLWREPTVDFLLLAEELQHIVMWLAVVYRMKHRRSTADARRWLHR
jgi:hypothetical protein